MDRRLICYPFAGDSVGGAHISILHLIRRLDTTRFRPVVVLHQEGALAEHLRRLDVPYTLLPLRGFAGQNPNLASIAWHAAHAVHTLLPFLRDRRIGIVHANDLRMNLTWALAARVAGVPLVWHQRTTPMSRSPLWSLLPLLANRVIAISDAVADSLRRGRWRPEVVYNPFDVSAPASDRNACRAALLSELGLPSDAILIAYVGRLVGYKRADICIRMVPFLREAMRRPVACLLIGAGSDAAQQALHDVARKCGVEQQVHFLGFRHPVEHDIAGCDLLVAPSEIEGFGRAVVEAMLAGTPVVASRIGGHVDIIDDGRTGCLVEAGNVKAFATAAQRLLSDTRLRDGVIAAARADARQRFSAEAHAETVMRMYSKLLTKRL